MQRVLGIALLFIGASMTSTAAEQQTFTGRISDSMCGASHQAREPRQCVFACLNKLAKYVLVTDDNQVIAIANQDAMGLPLHAGRPVKITGERKGDAIVVTKVERNPPPNPKSASR